MLMTMTKRRDVVICNDLCELQHLSRTSFRVLKVAVKVKAHLELGSGKV